MKKKTLTPENEKKLENFLKNNLPESPGPQFGEKDRILRAALQDETETGERRWSIGIKWVLPATMAAALTFVILTNPFKAQSPSAEDLALGEFLLSSVDATYSDDSSEMDSDWMLLMNAAKQNQ